jgi:hypothetical protein
VRQITSIRSVTPAQGNGAGKRGQDALAERAAERREDGCAEPAH